MSDIPSWGYGRMDVQRQRFGWDMFALCEVQFSASVVQSSLQANKEGQCGLTGVTVPSSRKKAVKSKGLLMDSACVGLSEMAPSRPTAKRSEGSPCGTPLLLGIFSDKTVVRVAHVGQVQRYSSDFPKKSRPINLIEGARQIHGQEAPFFVVVVFPEPSSDGLTALLCFEPQLCWWEVWCRLFGNSNQQGLSL